MEDFFNTSHLSGNLAKKTVQGGAAVGISRILSFVFSMGSTAILARLLVPGDFGLVAMVLAVLGFVMVFKEMGLSMATVQRKTVTHEQVSNLFWLNCLLGAVLAIIVVAVAPLIGMLYKDPRLVPVAASLSLTPVFSSLTVQHQAIARRHMKFWIVQSTGLGGNCIGIVVAVFMALQGFSYWALVAQKIVASAVTCILLWIFIPWRPGLPRRGTGVRSMVTFGLHISASRFVRMAKDSVDKLLIGYFVGPAALGLYTKAFSLLMLPVNQLNYPVSSVSFPALSRMQNDREKFRQIYYQGIGLLTSVTLPVITFLAITADDLIPLFLGHGWEYTIILFRLLAPAAFIQALALTRGWATIPLGQSKRIMYCNAMDAVITVVSCCIGIVWGAAGVALALSVSAVLKFVPLNQYAFRGSPISLSEVFTKTLLLPSIFCILAGTGCVIINTLYCIDNKGLSFVVEAAAFSLLYLGLPWCIPGGKNIFIPLQKAFGILFTQKIRS